MNHCHFGTSLLNWAKRKNCLARSPLRFLLKLLPKVISLSPSTRTHEWPPVEWESFMGPELRPHTQLIIATCQVFSYVSLNMTGQGGKWQSTKALKRRWSSSFHRQHISRHLNKITWPFCLTITIFNFDFSKTSALCCCALPVTTNWLLIDERKFDFLEIKFHLNVNIESHCIHLELNSNFWIDFNSIQIQLKRHLVNMMLEIYLFIYLKNIDLKRHLFMFRMG